MTERNTAGAQSARDDRDAPDSEEPSDSDDAALAAADLTGFQRDLLAVLVARTDADAETPGQRIKDDLEARGYAGINHGRLYPNLDDLTESGLVEKETGAYDQRTNAYRPTGRGRKLIVAHAVRLAGDVGLETEGSA